MQDGFNNNDASLMNARLADDAIVVNARGAVLSGRAAIRKASEEALAAGYLNDSMAYYELSDVASLSPDVVTARKNAWSTNQDADDGNPPEMNALYIFVKRDGRWLIWRRQNTIISLP
ncbi:SgcJ/EcaC family oxidoreductase [Rhodococcus sp. F64268]|nr:SgcJ/EcaC family oxidoreductase [Rhodococcus sp. F64268]